MTDQLKVGLMNRPKITMMFNMFSHVFVDSLTNEVSIRCVSLKVIFGAIWCYMVLITGGAR